MSEEETGGQMAAGVGKRWQESQTYRWQVLRDCRGNLAEPHVGGYGTARRGECCGAGRLTDRVRRLLAWPAENRVVAPALVKMMHEDDDIVC